MGAGVRVCVTGASGFLGRHVCEALKLGGHVVVAVPGRDALDLRRKMLPPYKAEVIVHLAYPGTKGIQTAMETVADLVRDQLRIDLNVLESAVRQKVQTLICIGSVCEYPEQVTYPTDETQLWSGYPEAVNAPYGIAKRMQQGLLDAYRRQYGLLSTQLILGNLYGPGDRSGHVIPSLIRRACHSARTGTPLVVWGDGRASREFLYVEDAARAIVAAVEAPPMDHPVNIVSGQETPMYRLATWIGHMCGYDGPLTWDRAKPNGQLRRWFSYGMAKRLFHWTPTMPFPAGLARTVAWLRAEEGL